MRLKRPKDSAPDGITYELKIHAGLPENYGLRPPANHRSQDLVGGRPTWDCRSGGRLQVEYDQAQYREPNQGSYYQEIADTDTDITEEHKG